MWEYRGPLETEEMQELVVSLMDESKEGEDSEDDAEAGADGDAEYEIDPLLQMDAVVWFCQGHACRVGVNHMDDNAPVYSIFQIEKSVSRMWSVGVPYILRTQAYIINDAGAR